MPFESLFRALDLRVLGDLEGAIAVLTDGINKVSISDANRELPALTHDLAMLCEAAGRLEEAICHFRKCLDVYPSDLGSLYGLARLLTKAGRLGEARVATEELGKACEASDEPLSHGWAELHAILERELNQLGGR